MMADPKFQQSLNTYLQGGGDPERETELEDRLITEEGFKSYLLGELTPKEHLFLEEHLFRDPQANEVFEMVEDELIEDYGNAALTVQEKERFEKFFVWTEERRQKLGLVEELKRFAANKRNVERRPEAFWEAFRAYWRFKNPILSWSLAAALLVIFAGGPLLMVDQRNQMYPTLASVSLSPGLLRGIGSGQEIHITAGIDLLLQLELPMVPEDDSRFLVVLEQIDGNAIFTQIFPKTESIVQSQTLKVLVSAEPLVYGDYKVKLSGADSNGDFEPFESYYFRIIRD